MKKVNVAQAKARLSELVAAAVAGERVVIARRGTPLVTLVAMDSARVKPVFGRLAGRIRMSDDFDQPLSDFADYVE